MLDPDFESFEQRAGGGLPSIMNSLTISQSCFICCSERYLQFLAASSHSSGPALRFNLAGPGWGISLSAMVWVSLVEESQVDSN